MGSPAGGWLSQKASLQALVSGVAALADIPDPLCCQGDGEKQAARVAWRKADGVG